MHSVLEAEKNTKDNGKLIKESINQGLSAFMPDMIFEHLVKNYSLAKQLYGEALLRLLSGYNPNYIRRNINIPEFQKELKKRMKDKLEELKEEFLIDKDYSINEKGFELASLTLYTEELDKLKASGLLGEKIHKKASHYGDKEEVIDFKKGSRYRDISVRRTIKAAVLRNHRNVGLTDLKLFCSMP